MTKTRQTSNIPVFSDVKAASYVEAVAEMAIKEAKRLLRDAKLLITWKTSNCGNLDNTGEVTTAFEGVFRVSWDMGNYFTPGTLSNQFRSGSLEHGNLLQNSQITYTHPGYILGERIYLASTT